MRLISSSKTNKQRGDTIVEVLIAIAVVSLILGGAYITTNRSLIATRTAEERSVALKLVESQLEQLKGFAKNNPQALFDNALTYAFCIDNSGQIVAATTPGCQVNGGGEPVGQQVQPRFRLSIQRATDNSTFTVTNQWDNVRGQGADNITMVYRIHE